MCVCCVCVCVCVYGMQAQALLKHSHDIRRLAAGFSEDNGHFCTPDSSYQGTFGQARSGSPLQSSFGNEREV